jgi:hypothetical protein
VLFVGEVDLEEVFEPGLGKVVLVLLFDFVKRDRPLVVIVVSNNGLR